MNCEKLIKKVIVKYKIYRKLSNYTRYKIDNYRKLNLSFFLDNCRRLWGGYWTLSNLFIGLLRTAENINVNVSKAYKNVEGLIENGFYDNSCLNKIAKEQNNLVNNYLEDLIDAKNSSETALSVLLQLRGMSNGIRSGDQNIRLLQISKLDEIERLLENAVKRMCKNEI